MITDLLTALLLIALSVVLAGGVVVVFVMWVGSRESMREGRPRIGSDPLDEHFKSAPRVVAGSDIDRQKAIQRRRDNAEFDAIAADTLADLDAHLSAYYAAPEGDR